ncbi:MAG TPA: chitobiase/beta-hexosaminidase C-terminal domain-containing protein [Solirubrobacteraceae bacterium]|nr:chitobiase/beta-hexosaminidase C-terminal domain-containing protein [Solirubrobacteraceae bacterium]
MSWGASTLSNGQAVAGYLVKRYISGGALQTTLAGCSGTITATTCTESDVPAGVWQYTVTPVIGTNWQGVESLESGGVTVAPATLTLGRTLFGAPLPQTTTGSITGFAASEGVGYRLDGATTLTGSPSTVSSAGAATISSLTIPSGTADGAHTVYALGTTSPFASQASVGIVTDTTPPTVSASLSPAANAAGWNRVSPVIVTLSANDGTGSGVAAITYTTDGSDPTTSGTAHVYSTAISVSTNTTIRYFATDSAGNSSATQTQPVEIDAIAPTNVIGLSSVTGGAALSGMTIYYRGSAAGSLALTNAVTDTGGSGPASSGTAALSGTSTGFSHTSSLVATPAGGPYVSNPLIWSAGTTSSPTETVTGSDVASNTATTPLSFVDDVTPPTGGVLSVNATAATGGGSSSYDTAAGFTIGPRTDYTDGTSGLASSALTLATAALSGGTCAGFGTPTTITGSPTQSATGATCYQYTLTGTDNVGNTAAISTIVKVDTTAPSPPTITLSGATGNTFINGATVYTNPQTGNSGGFTATATSADSESGIQGITFPTLAGFTGGGGTTTSSPYTTTYAWPAAATASGPQTVTATDNAGLTDTNTFTVTPDTAPPTGGTVTYAGGYNTSGSVSVGFTPGADAGAGLNASSGLLQRASATLAAGACGSFGAFATVASNQSSPYADTGGTSGNCYEYRYVISDAVGNQATYTSASVVKLDTQAPSQSLSLASPVAAILSGTTLYYNGALTGSFSLLDTLADPLSGVGSATFPGIATTGWTHAAQTVSTPTGGPFTSSGFAWTASPGNPGSYVVSGLDNAGNTGTATITFASDTTAPAGGSVAYANGVVNALSVSIATSTGSDAQSQVNAAAASVVRAVATLTTLTESCGSFSSFSAVTLVSGADTSVASGHCYKYEYLVPDNVGNQATYTSGSVAEVDTSGPQVTAIVSQESGGGTGVGKLAVGTKLILTFNQLLATGSVPTSFTGASENRAATLSGVLIPQDVTLTIPGITQAAVDTGSSAYFSGLCVLLCSAQSATFDGTVGNTNNGTVTTLTLTVTSVTPGSGSTLGTSSGGLIFTPATSLKDGGGNAASGSFNTAGSFKLF